MKTTAKISFTLSIFLYFPPPATCTFFSGTFFNDYNANGMRENFSHGYYEDGAVSIPVRLKSCNDASKDEVVAMTYTNEKGQYYFNISANESGNHLNDDSGEICYYLYVDVGQYSVSPYVTSGVLTQMTTNQVYPDSGRSEEEMVQPGDEVVWNVGIMGKSSFFMREGGIFDAFAEGATSTPATTTEMGFISTQSTDYPDSFFSSNGVDDYVADVIDSLDNHTTLDDIIEKEDPQYQLYNVSTIATNATDTLQVQALVGVQLDNIDSKMNDDARSLFESVCRSFLEDQLSVSTPPIGNIQCVVVDENFVAQSPGRAVRGNYKRRLSQVYVANVNVTGTAPLTNTFLTSQSIKFEELCVGTFTVQGEYFVRALHQAKQNSGSKNVVFQSVQNARGVMTSDAPEVSRASEQIDDPSNPVTGRLSSSGLAAIAAVTVFCLMSFFMLIIIKVLRSRWHDYSSMDEKSGSVNPHTLRKFDELSNNDFSTQSPTNSNVMRPTIVTPVSIRSNTNEIEVDIMSESFSGNIECRQQAKTSAILNSRVRRDLVAPPGKLGILVVNTAGFGPSVYSMQKGSPMEGLMFVNDMIIAINGIDTRDQTATQITQIMKETIDKERKITVLSSVR